MNRPHSAAHSAKYLVLLGPDTAPRALLFSGENRYLAEVIDDDGLMVEHLMRQGSRLRTPPVGLMLEAVVPPGELDDGVSCFALDAA